MCSADAYSAYSLDGHDLATLIAADKYSRMHQQQVAVNTSQWPLNENGRVIELNDFPARIRAKI